MARSLGHPELQSLLQTLADGGWHSGERLAQSAGLTRAGVSKRVHKLLELGLDLETRTGLGYRLGRPLDLLEADSIIGALSPETQARLPLSVVFSTDSTNKQLMDGASSRDPQALLAEHQSAGRGRRGRAWHSPLGANLYLSLAWTFPQWPAQLTALPLATGVATAEALTALGLRGLKLKWPNDLMVENRKLGGILIEQRGEAGGSCRVVLGLGINVHMSSATAVEQPWISLHERLGDQTPARNLLAARILDRWMHMLDSFGQQGFAPFAGTWQTLDLTYKQPVSVQNGSLSYDGVAQGVDESGALLVDVAGQTRRLLSGDVSLRLHSPLPLGEAARSVGEGES